MSNTITGIYPIDAKTERGEEGTWNITLFENYLEAVLKQDFEREDDIEGWKELHTDLTLTVKYSMISSISMGWTSQFERWVIEIHIDGSDDLFVYEQDHNTAKKVFYQLKEKYLDA
jgi:hypothetical protein